MSNLAKRWKLQRNALVKEMYHNQKIPSAKIPKLLVQWGATPLSQREIQRIVQIYGEEHADNAT